MQGSNGRYHPIEESRQARALVKTWDEHYAELLERRNQVGPLYAGKDDNLRVWTTAQREEYQRAKEGKSLLLTKEQVDKLLAHWDLTMCGVHAQWQRWVSWQELGRKVRGTFKVSVGAQFVSSRFSANGTVILGTGTTHGVREVCGRKAQCLVQ
jgi:hypothetical protein